MHQEQPTQGIVAIIIHLGCRIITFCRSQGPNQFDEEIVLRQLRYTGMLETVRIRQAGFNVRLTFEEFIHHYRILLPRGLLRLLFSPLPVN